MTKLCSEKGNPDADDTAADESNPYMSPFQATHKKCIIHVTGQLSYSFCLLDFASHQYSKGYMETFPALLVEVVMRVEPQTFCKLGG